MLVIPAIDLKDGRCVRLRQGDMREETVYSEDPAATALRWEGLGARLLHVVDLNGAIDGQPRNLPQIEAILKAVSIPIQVGGGIRTLETVRMYLSRGVKRVVMGTAVLQDRVVLEQACKDAGYPLTLRRQAGYDHGYYFISTFIEDHLRHHARALLA